MEIFDDAADFSVSQERIIGAQAETAIENWMMVENSRLVAMLNVRPAIAARMRELKTDDGVVIQAG
jgi:ribosomal protein S10